VNARDTLKLLWKLRQLRRHDRWTREQLQEHQTRSLRLLREYAYARSPFYRHFHEGLAGPSTTYRCSRRPR
jgi:phenylacetate-CoA ligase